MSVGLFEENRWKLLEISKSVKSSGPESSTSVWSRDWLECIEVKAFATDNEQLQWIPLRIFNDSDWEERYFDKVM